MRIQLVRKELPHTLYKKYCCTKGSLIKISLLAFVLLFLLLEGQSQITNNVYGKLDMGSQQLIGNNNASFNLKSSFAIAITGNIAQNSYNITGISNNTSVLVGMSIAGSGIPQNAVIVAVSGSTLIVSKMITAASANGVVLSVSSARSTVASAHGDGMEGSLPGFGWYQLDSAANYIFNNATETPFPASANASAIKILAGDITFNASISTNKNLYISGILTVNNNLSIPPSDSVIVTSGSAVAGSAFNVSKHIITLADTLTGTQGFFGVKGIASTYLLPVGSKNSYLPITLDPASVSDYKVSVFEGVTTDSRPNGPDFTMAQKKNIVDAVWNIVRTSTNTDSCNITLEWPQTLEGSSFTSDDSIGVAAYATAWGNCDGNANNTTNTATKKFNSFTAFTIGKKPFILGEPVPFTAGNIVVSRMGAGTTGPFSSTNNVYLDEYTPTGNWVRSLALPSTSGAALLQSNNIDEGRLSRSQDGQYLTLAGYSKTGSSGVNGNTSVINPRSIGIIKYNGVANVIVPPATAPIATASGTVVTGSPTTITNVSVSSGTLAVGQYVYGSYVPNGATITAIAGTTVTLSSSGGTNGSSTFQFMAAATPNYSNVKSPGSVITSDGTDFWLCSRETSIQYYNKTNNTLGTISAGTTGTTARFLNISDGQLYASNDFGFKMATVGTGLPVSATSTTAFPFNAGVAWPTSPTQFCMLDASGSVAGADVMYVAETGGSSSGILKYSKVGSTWVSNGGYGSYADIYQGLTGVVNGGSVTLYAVRKTTTAAGGELVKIVDAGAYNTTMSATATVLASYNTGANLGGSWRSIAFAPVSGGESMPLRLTNFSATPTLHQTTLKWVTMNEVNVDGFDIEKSMDATHFVALGKVMANNNAKINNYLFIDKIDKNANSNTSYYRLNMKDKDGLSRYSNIISVKMANRPKMDIYTLYPNPVEDVLYIRHSAFDKQSLLNIYDMQGHLLKQQQVPAQEAISTMKLGEMAIGTYLVELVNNGNTVTGTFIKSKK